MQLWAQIGSEPEEEASNRPRGGAEEVSQRKGRLHLGCEGGIGVP